jgi:integrase
MAEKPSANPLLFEGENGQIRDGCWARSLFQKLLNAAGIQTPQLSRYERGICLHCFRHTFAVNSLRAQDLAGNDIYSAAPLLSIYLGHAKLVETQRYLHMTAENSKDILSVTNKYSQGLFPEVPQ